MLLAGVLSPMVAILIPRQKWLLYVFLIATAAVVAAIWIIAAAIDAEAAKPKESLDVLLGYAIDFWMVVIGALLIAVSVALKAWFLLWKAKRSS